MRRLLLVVGFWLLATGSAMAHPGHVDRIVPRFMSPAPSADGLPPACLSADSAGHTDREPSAHQTKFIYVHRASRPNLSEGWSPWINQASQVLQRHLARSSGYQKGFFFDLTEACGDLQLDLPVGSLDSASNDPYELFSQLREKFGAGSGAEQSDNVQVLFDGGIDSAIAGLGEMHPAGAPDGGQFSVTFLPGLNQDGSNSWGKFLAHVMLHELLHNIGAVALSAPHSTGEFHSNQGDDIMFAAAGTPGPAEDCYDHNVLPPIDCGHDDYFQASPVSELMSDPARNVFLSAMLADCAEAGCQPPVIEAASVKQMWLAKRQRVFYARLVSSALQGDQAEAHQQLQRHIGRRWQTVRQNRWSAELIDEQPGIYASLLPRLTARARYRVRAIVVSGAQRTLGRWKVFRAR